MEGVALSLSLSAISHGPPLSHEHSIPTDYTLTILVYSSIFVWLTSQTVHMRLISSCSVSIYLCGPMWQWVKISKLEAHLTRGEVNKVETTRGSTPHASKLRAH